MLPSSHRLRRRYEVEAILRHGRRFKSSELLLVVRSRVRGGLWRGTVVVGKKVDKRAVIRNRYKRMIRADLAELQGKLQPGVDILIQVRRRFPEDNHAALSSALEQLLRQTKLLHD